MNVIGRIVIKLLAALFALLFVIPAILFSVLVLGMTESWQSGTVMLATSILLLIIVDLQAKSYAPNRRSKNKESHLDGDVSEWEIGRNERVPPPLSDLYDDLREQELETEIVYRTIVGIDAGTLPKIERGMGKGNNTTPY
jgi:hypothetical protein